MWKKELMMYLQELSSRVSWPAYLYAEDEIWVLYLNDPLKSLKITGPSDGIIQLMWFEESLDYSERTHGGQTVNFKKYAYKIEELGSAQEVIRSIELERTNNETQLRQYLEVEGRFDFKEGERWLVTYREGYSDFKAAVVIVGPGPHLGVEGEFEVVEISTVVLAKRLGDGYGTY